MEERVLAWGPITKQNSQPINPENGKARSYESVIIWRLRNPQTGEDERRKYPKALQPDTRLRICRRQILFVSIKRRIYLKMEAISAVEESRNLKASRFKVWRTFVLKVCWFIGDEKCTQMNATKCRLLTSFDQCPFKYVPSFYFLIRTSSDCRLV